MAPVESGQDWEAGGEEVDLDYIMEKERSGARSEEYVQVEGEVEERGSSGSLDLLSVYFKQIGKIPLQHPNQEFKTAVTVVAARLFQQWREHPESKKSGNVWEEILIQLFRSWDAVCSYCAICKVDQPHLTQVIGDAEHILTNINAKDSSYIQEYLRCHGWSRGEKKDSEEEEEPEVADPLEKLTKPLFIFLYAAVLLPQPLRRFIRTNLGKDAQLPPWEETHRALQALTPDIFASAGEKIVLRGKEARALLVLSNTRFAINKAKGYREKGVDFSDLIQDANVGLLDAADTFEPHRGNRFCTYAGWRLRKALSDGVKHEGRTVRLKGNTAQEIAGLHEAKRIFKDVRGREPTLEELAIVIGKSVAVIQRIEQAGRQGTVSLDATLDSDDGEGNLLERLEASVPDPSERAYQLALKDVFDEVLRTLDPRERTIIVLRHGLENGPPYSLEQVATIMEITRERVRQIGSRGEARIIRMIADRFPRLLPEGMSRELAHVLADRRDYHKKEKGASS